jgi:hypothetical protein
VAPRAGAPNVSAAVTGTTPAQRNVLASATGQPAPPAAPPPVAAAAPTTPAERQALCLEILQKASLEPISQAETAFFKKECK